MLTIIPGLHIKEQQNLQDLTLSSKLKKKTNYAHLIELLHYRNFTGHASNYFDRRQSEVTMLPKFPVEYIPPSLQAMC